MISRSCLPTYSYEPDFTPSSASCQAPVYSEHRSRLMAGGGFFRSIEQGPDTNLIEAEFLGGVFKVYYNGIMVESHNVVAGIGSFSTLRSALASSAWIQMPAWSYDVYDTRLAEDNVLGGMSYFVKSPFIGGSGGPTSALGLAAIRTGPSRTIFVLSTTESADGSSIDPPANRKVQQWDGVQWITYSNLVSGSCPI